MSSPNPNVNSIKSFKNRRISKTVTFMETEVTIQKLTTNQVLAVQEKAESGKNDPQAGLNLMIEIIKLGAPALADGGSKEDFLELPLDALTELSTAITDFSGMSTGEKGKV